MPRKKGKKQPQIVIQGGAGFGSFLKSVARAGTKVFKTGKKAFKAVKKFRPATKLLKGASALGVPLPPQVQKLAMIAKQKGFGKKRGRKPMRGAGMKMGSKTGSGGQVIY